MSTICLQLSMFDRAPADGDPTVLQAISWGSRDAEGNLMVTVTYPTPAQFWAIVELASGYAELRKQSRRPGPARRNGCRPAPGPGRVRAPRG